MEIQPFVDLTYRLYDYGRPRELHLKEAADVVHARPHSDPRDTNVNGESRVLVDGPHFGVAWCVGAPPSLPADMHAIQLLPVDAPVSDVAAGECALLDSEETQDLTSGGTFVLAWSTAARSS